MGRLNKNKKYLLKDLDEYVRLAKANGITSGKGWIKYYKDIKHPSYRLAQKPWVSVYPKISQAEFGELLLSKELLTNLNEYVRLAKENGITSGGQWSRVYKDIKYPSHRLASEPWNSSTQKITQGDFGKLIRPYEKEFLTDLNEYIRLAKENGITTSYQWSLDYKDIDYKPNRLPSRPCDVISPKISCDEFSKLLNPDEKEFLTDLNEYIRLAKENGITSGHQWFKSYKDIEYPSHKLASVPWVTSSTKVTRSKFRKLLRGKFLTDLNEYVRLAKENGITNGGQWRKRYKNIKYPSHRLASEPWKVVSTKITFTEFGDLLGGKFLTDLSEYIRLAKENGFINGGQWFNGYKSIDYPSHRLASQPWKAVSPPISGAKFGELLSGKMLTDLNEYVRLGKENGVTNGSQWVKGYKYIEYHSNRLSSSPWDVVSPPISEGEFGKLLRPNEKEMLRDLDEYIRIANENGITNGLSWVINYKKFEYSRYRLASHPWKAVSPKITFIEFGELLKPNRKEFLTDIDEYVRLAKKNGISSGYGWFIRYKDIEYPTHKLYSSPWSLIFPKMSCADFTKIINTE